MADLWLIRFRYRAGLIAFILSAALTTYLMVIASQIKFYDGPRQYGVMEMTRASTLSHFPVIVKDLPRPWWGNLFQDKIQDFSYKVYQFSTINLGESLLYYFIPIVGKSLGLNRPFLSLSIFMGLILWVATYIGIKRAIENRFFSVYFLLCLASFSYVSGPYFPLISVYFQHMLIIFILIPLCVEIMLFSKDGEVSHLKWIILLSLFSAISVLVRSTTVICFMGMIGFMLAVAVFPVKSYSKKKLLAGTLICFSFFCGFKWALKSEHLATDRVFTEQHLVQDHVFWHTVWCSLGDPGDPKYPFKWSDSAAGTFVTNKDPKIIGASEEYENTLKNSVLEVFQKDKLFFWKHLKSRFIYDVKPFLSAVAIFFAVIFFGIYGLIGKMESLVAGVALGTTLLSRVAPTLSINTEAYYYQIHLIEGFVNWLIFYLVLAFAKRGFDTYFANDKRRSRFRLNKKLS